MIGQLSTLLEEHKGVTAEGIRGKVPLSWPGVSSVHRHMMAPQQSPPCLTSRRLPHTAQGPKSLRSCEACGGHPAKPVSSALPLGGAAPLNGTPRESNGVGLILIQKSRGRQCGGPWPTAEPGDTGSGLGEGHAGPVTGPQMATVSFLQGPSQPPAWECRRTPSPQLLGCITTGHVACSDTPLSPCVPEVRGPAWSHGISRAAFPGGSWGEPAVLPLPASRGAHVSWFMAPLHLSSKTAATDRVPHTVSL